MLERRLTLGDSGTWELGARHEDALAHTPELGLCGEGALTIFAVGYFVFPFLRWYATLCRRKRTESRSIREARVYCLLCVAFLLLLLLLFFVLPSFRSLRGCCEPRILDTISYFFAEA